MPPAPRAEGGSDLSKRLISLILCLFLCCGAAAFPAGAAEEKAAPDVRVLLRRLALTDRIDLTFSGAYTAQWGKDSRMLLPDGGRVSVQIREGRLCLFYRDAALDCGESLVLRRSGGTASRGLTIAPWDALYPGDLTLTVSGGQLQPVLTVNVEDYLLGVLPYEMGDDFPLEALKAQAVCARTYALGRMDAKKAWDLVDTTNDQVYRGTAGKHERSDRAVRETAGVVGTSGGALAHCYYSASNGGQTELPSHVWSGEESSRCYALTDDPYDLENPESVVRKAVLRKDGKEWPEELTACVREILFRQPQMADFVHDPDAFRVDALTALTLSKPRFAAPSRLMTRMDITVQVSGRQYLAPETPDPLTYEPDEGAENVTPEPTATPVPERILSDFRPAGVFTLSLDLFPALIRGLGLSIYGADNEIVTVTEEKDRFVLSSGRYGHGVGMSQRGAQWMAGHYGLNFQEILNFYYPGMKLQKVSAGPPAVPTPDPRLAGTPGPAATPTPRPTLMPVSTDGMPEGAWLASVENIEDDSSLNLRAEPRQSGEILMRLYKHQRLIVLETCEDPSWVHVRTDSAEGYVMVSFLEKAE